MVRFHGGARELSEKYLHMNIRVDKFGDFDDLSAIIGKLYSNLAGK